MAHIHRRELLHRLLDKVHGWFPLAVPGGAGKAPQMAMRWIFWSACIFGAIPSAISSGAICIHYITLHYITLHYITLHYITLHYITLHYITLHYITLHYITLHYITLHYITLHYITLHYITLHYITLHYITLHYITLHYITYIHTYIHIYIYIYIIIHTYIYIYIYHTHLRKQDWAEECGPGDDPGPPPTAIHAQGFSPLLEPRIACGWSDGRSVDQPKSVGWTTTKSHIDWLIWKHVHNFWIGFLQKPGILQD